MTFLDMQTYSISHYNTYYSSAMYIQLHYYSVSGMFLFYYFIRLRLNDSVTTDTDDMAGFDEGTSSPKRSKMSRKQLSTRVHVSNTAWGEDSRLGQGITRLLL